MQIGDLSNAQSFKLWRQGRDWQLMAIPFEIAWYSELKPGPAGGHSGVGILRLSWLSEIGWRGWRGALLLIHGEPEWARCAMAKNLRRQGVCV